MTYRLAIFDFDGTLADTFPWFISVMNTVADRYRFRRIEEHDIDRLRALGAREIITNLAIPAWKLPLIARHMRMLAAQHPAVLFPGVSQMLSHLADCGVTIAVVTSNTEYNVRRTLGPAAETISHFACGASLFGKAAKFRKVLAQSRVGAHEALCIGDEIRDYEAARSAGIAFGAALWGYTRRDALEALEPDLLLESIDVVAAELGLERLRTA